MTIVIRKAAILAGHATWRLTVMVFTCLLVIAGPGVVLLGAMVGPKTALVGFAVIVLFPLSLILHEFGHAFPALHAIRVEDGEPGCVQAKGGWTYASIVRPRFHRRSDIVVTAAGPLAGASIGVLMLIFAVVLIEQPNVFVLVVVLPFCSHLLALTPFSRDGVALLEALYRRELSS